MYFVRTPLVVATQTNNSEMIKKLCQSKANINFEFSNNKRTMISSALESCLSDNKLSKFSSILPQTMKTLLDIKADLSKPANSSWLLKQSVTRQESAKLQLLFDYGIKIKSKAEYDELLRTASKLNNSKTVEILLKNKFSTKIYNEECSICLESVKSQKNLHVTPCHHAFHINCWTKYNKSICPICS